MNKKDLLKLIVDLQERISKLEANKSIIQPYRTYIPYIKTDQCSLGGDCRYPDPISRPDLRRNEHPTLEPWSVAASDAGSRDREN